MLKMKAKYDSSMVSVAKKAVEAIERKRPADRELAEVEKCFKADFKEIVRALEKRRDALKRINSDDELEELYKWMNKLSKLSH